MFDFDIGDILLAVVFVMVVGIVGLFIVDGLYYNVKSEPAVVACRQKQMDHIRYSFTDSVVCVPVPFRRDTLTVQ